MSEHDTQEFEGSTRDTKRLEWYFSVYKVTELLELLKVLEIVVLHSVIMLLSSTDPCDQAIANIYQAQFDHILNGDFSE